MGLRAGIPKSAAIAAAAAGRMAKRIARGQAYPARPVRIICGFPGGSSQDIVARIVGQWLSERLGQPVIIDNRPGAGGNIAVEAVVNAPADGYTLLMTGPNNAVNATLYDNLKFNFIRDIAPVARHHEACRSSWRSTCRSRPGRFPSSSPMPRPIRARSTWHRPATEPRSMCPASCSR